MKNTLLTVLGLIGAFVSNQFGGWTAAMGTLIVLMAIDYFSGLIVAGVFHKSQKSESGALESRAGWKGLIRKGMTLLIILVASKLDILIGTSYIKDTCAIAFCLNEIISIIENAGLMGIWIPSVILKAIDILKDREESKNG